MRRDMAVAISGPYESRKLCLEAFSVEWGRSKWPKATEASPVDRCMRVPDCDLHPFITYTCSAP